MGEGQREPNCKERLSKSIREKAEVFSRQHYIIDFVYGSA